MKGAGYDPILRVLAALPATAAQVHQRVPDITLPTITDWLRAAVRTGIAHIERVEHVGARLFERHFAFGPGESARWPHEAKDGGRSPVAVISLALVIEALRMGPSTVLELAQETGLERRGVSTVLAKMRRHKLARVAQWPYVGHPARPVPAWALGSAADARKPQRTPRKVVNAKSWARRKQRREHMKMLSATAGRRAA